MEWRTAAGERRFGDHRLAIKGGKKMFLMLMGIMFIWFGAAFLGFLFRLALYLSPIGLLMLLLRPRYRRYRRYYW